MPERPADKALFFPVPHFVVMEPLIVSLDFLEFPPTHTCDGDNLSPRIRIKGLNAASIAVMVFNPFEKSCCSFTPWIIWNIPPVSVIPAGIPREGIVTAPVTAVQGITDHGYFRVYRTLPATRADDTVPVQSLRSRQHAGPETRIRQARTCLCYERTRTTVWRNCWNLFPLKKKILLH